VLDFSKIEAGKLELDMQPVELASTLRMAAESMRFAAEQKELELVVSLDPQLPETVDADPQRLTQVLVNLLSNAVKFTEHGFVQLRVEQLERSPERSTLRFAVRDTGIGIEPEQRTLIFESFTQADPSTTRRYGGTGLGLAISNRIVTALGGALELESEPGVGSTFSFTLELRVPAGGDEAAGPEEAAPEQAPAGCWRTAPVRILVVEDERINLLATRTMIRRLNEQAETVPAHDGLEAVELASREEFDLILMDVQMPRLDGYEATQRIREAEGQDRRVPIVALTAGVLTGERDRCLAAGMDDYLSKPVSMDSLCRALSAWLPEPG
jgi:CheY-like chemotaxis protein